MSRIILLIFSIIFEQQYEIFLDLEYKILKMSRNPTDFGGMVRGHQWSDDSKTGYPENLLDPIRSILAISRTFRSIAALFGPPTFGDFC